MKDIWALIQNDRFIDACQEADLEYQLTGNIFPLKNKLFALLNLQKYVEVIELADSLIKIENAESSSPFIISGIAHWLLNNKNEAVACWINAKTCNYQDAAGGMEELICRYFAAVKMADEASRKIVRIEIKKLLKNKRSLNWPGPLGFYLLSESTERELLSSVSDTKVLYEKQLCEANFVIAIRELEMKDMPGYLAKLRECIKHKHMAYSKGMYYLAKGELIEMNLLN